MPEQTRPVLDERRRLIILVASPLTNDIVRRVFANELAIHFHVIIGDCLQWVRKTDVRVSFTPGKFDEVVSVTSEDEFDGLLELEKPAFVLDFIGKGKYTRAIQDICHRVGALYITHLLAPNPAPVSSASPVRSLLRSPLGTLKRMFSAVLRRLQSNAPRPPDIALLAGEASKNPWTMSAKKVIFTPTPAFFELRRVLKDEDPALINIDQSRSDGYIVFIDDCIAESFDFMLGDHDPVVKTIDYYQEINAFFADVEKVTGLPIVIAAHPNGREIDGYARRFGDRKVVFGETAKLIISCKYSMTHYSSAINYSVMLRKPVVLISFSELERTPEGKTQAYMHKLLRCGMARLEDRENLPELMNRIECLVDKEAYSNYERMFITNIDPVPEHVMAPLVAYLQQVAHQDKNCV